MKIRFQPLPILLAASCCALLQGPATAQASGPQKAAQESAAVPRALPMVLHLVNGVKLRVRARLVEGQWEIIQSKQTSYLPADQVQRAVLEKKLLREAGKLNRASSKRQPASRAAYADWLASEGLTVEALKELDRLLSVDPDLKAARDVVKRQQFALGLPEIQDGSPRDAIKKLIGAAVRFGPAGREAAAQKLSRVEPSRELHEALLESLVNKNRKRRSFAALGLRRALSGQHMQPLMQRAILDPSSDVRLSASLALAAFERPEIVGPVIRAMGSKHSQVRINASAALGNMGYRSAVAPLMAQLNSLQSSEGRKPHANFYSGNQQAYIQDFDVEVASGSAIADPLINVLHSGTVLDVGVLSTTQRPILQERAAIRTSLSKLTGATPGTSTKHWMQWWEKNRLAYQPKREVDPNRSTSRGL